MHGFEVIQKVFECAFSAFTTSFTSFGSASLPPFGSAGSRCQDRTTPVIVLNGTQAGGGESGLRISAGGSTVRGLIIQQFTLKGIHITAAGGNTIEGNYISIDVTGLLDRGNGSHGLHVESDTGTNTIGGLTAAKRNVISGNGANGIFLQASSDNNVLGNYIGADKNGSPNLGNDGHGIFIEGGDDNTVGGAVPGGSNIISGNQGSGVAIKD